MKHRLVFMLSVAGLLAGLVAAWLFGMGRRAQPPAFAPVSNPFATAIYANGIIESEQGGGSNVAIYPEVAGTVSELLVHEGQSVTAGTPLIRLDDAVQRAATEQLRLQADASLALLNELQAQPRRENLDIAKSQAELAAATLKAARDQYDKRQATFEIDQRSISKDALDTARDALAQATSARDVAQRQYVLVKAGAWSFDIENQRKLHDSQLQAWRSANALLQKYALRARTDGVVMALGVAPGSYVSPQGTYDSTTQAQLPPIVMSAPQGQLAVRCYVDEILVSRLPAPGRIQAQMSIRGTDVKVPLEFVRVQPYVTPKIELSDQRQEKVDLRVLPVIFRFKMKTPTMAYPGQLVDVFIGQK